MKPLVNLALLLTLCTIVLGAYTRLTDAGLGCPDWPGCYGFISVPSQPAQIREAHERYPAYKVEPHKARSEMLHRYLAGSLGLVILAIFTLSCWQHRLRFLSSSVLALVVMQAVLGMLTVSLNLLPLIVLGHLLGGFSLLSLLALLRLRLGNVPVPLEPGLVSLRPLAWSALVVLTLQISLGVWASANYAALACHELPVCESGWQARFDMTSAFSLPLGHETYQYGVLPYEARMSIHVLHRCGAMVTAIFLASLAVLAWRRAATRQMRALAISLGVLLCVQVVLGIINVVAWLPLANALAHNFVAANLLMTLIVFLDRLYGQQTASLHESHQGLQLNQTANHYTVE